MYIVLFLLFFTFCEASPRIIGVPVLHLRTECSDSAPLDSQGVYGHSVELVEDFGNGWGVIEAGDGYRGYGRVEGLLADDLRWRRSERLVKVASIAGLVYPTADTEIPALLRLPFDARVEVLGDFEANQERWLRVQLADGSLAWMQRGDLEKPKIRTIEEVVELSHQFLGLPYIWGGNSSEGYDCSGFVQTMYKQMGVLLPRNSKMQASSDKVVPVEAPELPGDLLFFGEAKISHVGLYLGEGRFIHSGVRNHKPRVHIARLDDTGYTYACARRVKTPVYEARRKGEQVEFNHWGFDGCVHEGTFRIPERLAEEVIEIFSGLFSARFPVEKVEVLSTTISLQGVCEGDLCHRAFVERGWRADPAQPGVFSK